MTAIVPLPAAVRGRLGKNTHPSLMLDKYVASWDTDANPEGLSERVQKPALEAVVRLAQQPPPGLDFPGIQQRQRRMLQAMGASVFSCVTTGPLTLHLARASALENAGICLHPLYGFVILPGSGLKGMARAYAETVDQASKDELAAVFGGTDAAGSVVFHDAWPLQWPRLAVDILNNHHAGYYQKNEPPGDWDNPVPVYFLSVSAPATFSFALSKRRADVPDAILQRARQWLLGALCHLGAGAKTNSGYGSFKPVEGQRPAIASARLAPFQATLSLVTPAFLAGAQQDGNDCDLRPATLRGLLRWWWRTMHAGFVDAPTLARLEAAVWGDTQTGGPLRVTLEQTSSNVPLQYDKRILCQKNQLPAPPNNKTTQGLWYHTFGMDDNRNDQGQRTRFQRWFLPPGSSWGLRFVARPSAFDGNGSRGRAVTSITLAEPTILLEQAKSALWLLCQFGGVGSKSRKGFGSLAMPKELEDWNLQRCREAAGRLRAFCRVPNSRGCGSPTLEQAILLDDVPTCWTNYWYALDRVAAVAQSFAQDLKHNPEKKALGLPRGVRPPFRGSFRPGPHVAKTSRHASPVLYHLAEGADGLIVRAVAFPSPELPEDPTLEKSRQFLGRLISHLGEELPRIARAESGKGRTDVVNPSPGNTASPASPSGSAPPSPARPQIAPPAGKVRVTVIGAHAALKDAYFVQEEGKKKGLLKYGSPPAGQKTPEPGDILEVFLRNTDPRSPEYGWDPPPPPPPPRGTRGPQRRR